MIALDIDSDQLQRIADEFGASEKDLRLAFSRALSRTSRTLRMMARKYLREGLELRAASVLKARLRLARYRAKGSGMGAARLWVGANDLPATAFKGKPRQTSRGVRVGGRTFDGAFVGTGRDSGKQMVFKRINGPQKRRGPKGSELPISAVTVPVQEEVNDIIDRQVFQESQDLIMTNFRAELRGRTIYRVGR